jgi:hypothetical protein
MTETPVMAWGGFGVKLVVTPVLEVPAGLSLAAIIAIAGTAIVMGWWRSRPETPPAAQPRRYDTRQPSRGR